MAYSLGITDLDPLRYGLLFERFLNPERVSMPDFDVDFCQDGRDRVIDYVRQKYGNDSVSQIVTFGTMAAKAVVRDVGRVMEWNYSRTDELAKLIPFQPGKLITLQMAREMEPRLKEREETEEETRELLALAGQLEGLSRNVGMHAGGVLIAPGKLSDFCPLYAASGSDSAVSQLDKDDVEAIGLVKFDFLGLTTLTSSTGRCVSSNASIRNRKSCWSNCPSTTRLRTEYSPQPIPLPCSSSNRAACATCSSRHVPDRLRGHHRAGRVCTAGPDGN